MKKDANTNQEQISVNHISDKGLIYRICKECSKLIDKKINTQRQWAKDFKRHFTMEDKWVADSHRKRCSTSLVREMQTPN